MIVMTEPDPHLVLMDRDPEPGGPKQTDPKTGFLSLLLQLVVFLAFLESWLRRRHYSASKCSVNLRRYWLLVGPMAYELRTFLGLSPSLNCIK
jgi:hypothetical protein